MRDRLLWTGCLAYAVFFTWLGSIKYAAHRNLVDFGIFAQTIVNAFGCFCNPIEGSHWAFHFSPFLYAVALAVHAVPSPLTLIALQAIAGALVAPPIYALVRKHTNRQIALLAAAVVWLYPPLAGLIFGDFHENGFAPAAVAWTLYAFDADLSPWVIVGAVVTLAIKEDQALFLAVAGALGAWRFRGTNRGRVAATVALLGIVALVLFFAFIRPHAAAASHSWEPVRFYTWSATDFRAWPSATGARLGFLLLIFVPLLFLPFRSSWMWLAAAPLGEVLLSRMPTTFTLGTHYAGAWIGYVLAAFACGVRDISARRARTLLVCCLALCALELAVANPLHPGVNLHPAQPRDRALDAFLHSLPPNLDIATQEEAYTHLALRDPQATLLPERPQTAIVNCYVLLDSDYPQSPRLQEYGSAFQGFVAAGRYIAVRRTGGIVLYRRAGCRA